MKILHLIDSGGFYGAEAVLIELAKEQKKQGLDVQVCSIGTLKDSDKQIELICHSENIPVHVFRMRSGPNITGALKILAFAKKEKFHILHSHGYKTNILFGLLPEFYRKIPFIVTLHGWTTVKPLTKIWLYEKLDALLLKNRKFIVLVSHAMAMHPNLKNIKDKCTIIENGISPDLPVISEGWIQRKLFEFKKNGKQVVGTIGRLSFEKGFDILIRAFAKCEQSLLLVIIGDGPLRDELELLAGELGVKSRILFLGYVDQASKFIPMLDVYVNSSRTEGTPITLLEAMRAKVRIVARDVGGNRKLLDGGNYGLLVEDEAPDTMARILMKSLLSNNERVIKGYDQFLDKYTVAAMSKKYTTVYMKLLDLRK